MNPIALGMIALGLVLLLIGVFNLIRSKRTNGLAFSLLGLLAIVFPFVVSYFLAR